LQREVVIKAPLEKSRSTAADERTAALSRRNRRFTICAEEHVTRLNLKSILKKYFTFAKM